MVSKLLDACAPKPQKPARKPPSKRAAAPAAPPTPRRDARPGLAPAPGRWLTAQYPLPLKPGLLVAQHMNYWLYVPKRVPDTVAQHGWPLVVMLHGCHQSAAQFAEGTRMNRLAEDKGYALLYPQQLASAQAQRCWRWYDRSTQQGGGETAQLAALVGKVCEDHAIDRRRIYACGLSAGAGMAAVLALNHPELIAAVALHSGPVFGAGHSPVGALQVMRHGAPTQADAAILGVLQRRSTQDPPAANGPMPPMPPMPAILIQGEDDRVVHPVNQRQLARQWLQLNGLADGPATRVTVKAAGRGGSRNAHEVHDYLVRRKLVLRVARIAGLGHAWSGGDPELKFNAKAGPNASRMVLDFFGKHRR
ncbi:extracellular catalytic domain type 1 short-chain-length polyhydroxyalkanoate depolymerase [Massilia niastensis]|uniref:extracellular catalytic domain type 1 short-chain-length polyhydroxyalkanoate depolymerase n=1 Tax=Massilia niastensis TaxID=544911 RepID=UPI001E5CBE2B|nr:PHB depolymerase family esterase [Massilia niastensis]